MKGYDIKIRLDKFKPLYWRDLIIPAGITFKDLDDIFKILWGFTGYHLSQFTFKNSDEIIAGDIRMFPFAEDELDGKEVIIDLYFETTKKIYWEYDFGDGWSFTVEIKKTVDYDKDYPTVKRFKGEYDLADDIGGTYGFKKLILENPDELSRFDLSIAQMNLEDFRNYLISFF